jgi:Tfp pilus assembly protein PilX
MEGARRERFSFAELGHEPGPGGFALPAALLAVLLIAVLIAGAFSAIVEETRMGAAAADRQLALLSAESAVESAIAVLSASADDSIGLGETRSWPVEGLGAPAVVYVTRLDASRYWIVANAGGTSPNSGVARRIGVVVRATKGSPHSITIDRIPERGWSELF